jgi:hypothetical protein
MTTGLSQQHGLCSWTHRQRGLRQEGSAEVGLWCYRSTKPTRKRFFFITVHYKIRRNLVLTTSKVNNTFVIRASFVPCPVVLVTLVWTVCQRENSNQFCLRCFRIAYLWIKTVFLSLHVALNVMQRRMSSHIKTVNVFKLLCIIKCSPLRIHALIIHFKFVIFSVLCICLLCVQCVDIFNWILTR